MVRRGGLKFVVDVPVGDRDGAILHLNSAGFEVKNYYTKSLAPTGVIKGWIRLGAEMPFVDFSEEELRRIEQKFALTLDSAAFPFTRQGSDDWAVGNDLLAAPPGSTIAPMEFRDGPTLRGKSTE